MEDFYRQFIGIAVVLGGLVALLWFAKKRGAANWNFRRSDGDRLVRIVERVSLTPQHTLFVLDIAGRTTLLATSPGSCQIVSELPASVRESAGAVKIR